VKPDINSVEVHPSLRPNRHPMDGILMGASGVHSGPFGVIHSPSTPKQTKTVSSLFLLKGRKEKERKGKGKVEGQLG